MRPGQNKRMRGRSRRGPNPLTRSFESNGPDVKIRGTAAHIAEKYVTLARDAHASGDPVAAESYLQHAEHYLRLIAAAQAQQVQTQQAVQNGGRIEDIEDGYDGDDEFESSVMDRFTFRAPQIQHPPGYIDPNGDQPRQDYQPRQDVPVRNDAPRHDQQPREQRGDRPDRGERSDFRRDRNGNEFRRDRNGERGQPRFERPVPVEPVEGEAALPSFITAPVRIPIEGNAEAPREAITMADGGEAGDEAGRFPLRARRRRNRRGPREDGAPEGQDGGQDGGQDAAPADIAGE